MTRNYRPILHENNLRREKREYIFPKIERICLEIEILPVFTFIESIYRIYRKIVFANYSKFSHSVTFR